MLKLLSTLGGQKEEFIPIKGNKVGMFVCGPTVYDYSHIGHARTYVIFDVIAKYLRHKGYKVKFVMNITDIDEKIIQRVKEEGESYKKISDFYESVFREDLKVLKIDSIDRFAKATEHIDEIIKQIKTLIEKGYAYISEDGIYFDISKFEDYGKLSKRTVEQAEDAISRIDESISKKNKGDFALWRFLPLVDVKQEKINAPTWSSPWGEGIPGWHIEDTAISEKYLGQQYEIHCGARDLTFPHHEAEIAQQESASGKKPFVKYWLHSGFVTVNGQKMSKSLKNFVTIKEILKEYLPAALRFMILSAYYRSPIDYKKDLMEQSEAAIQRFHELINKLELVKKAGFKEEKEEIDPVIQLRQAAKQPNAEGKSKMIYGVDEIIKNTKTEFEAKMDDDFNTPEAMAVLFNFARIINTFINDGVLDKKSAEMVLGFLSEIDKVFGIIPKISDISDEIFLMAEEREKLRKEKRWVESDKIRDQIIASGYLIEDTQYGPLIKKNLEISN